MVPNSFLSVAKISENLCNMKGTDVNNNILPSKQLRGKFMQREMNSGPWE